MFILVLSCISNHRRTHRISLVTETVVKICPSLASFVGSATRKKKFSWFTMAVVCLVSHTLLVQRHGADTE